MSVAKSDCLATVKRFRVVSVWEDEKPRAARDYNVYCHRDEGELR